MNLIKVENGKVTSVEMVEEINFFREKELGTEKYTILMHKSLLGVIRDEFEEEISQQEILPSEYESRGKKYPMFELTLNQAKQILVRESKLVRKAVIKRLDELENKLPVMSKLEMIAEIANGQLDQEKRIEKLEHKFENILTIDSGKQRKLQKAIASRVYDRSLEVFRTMESGLVELRKRMFSGIHRELKNKFGVSSYKDVKDSEFEIALNFVSNWIENADIRELV